MSRREAATGPDGLAVVDKAAGWTSHDVVAKARGPRHPQGRPLRHPRPRRHRRAAPRRRPGHPAAALPAGLPKTYTGEIVLGTATSTLDAVGRGHRHPRHGRVTPDAGRGPRPPRSSARSSRSRRWCRPSRSTASACTSWPGRAIEVEREPRPVTVHRFEVDADRRPAASTGSRSTARRAPTSARSPPTSARPSAGEPHLRDLRRTRSAPSRPRPRPCRSRTSLVLSPAGGAARLPAGDRRRRRAGRVAHGKVLDADQLGASPATAPGRSRRRTASSSPSTSAIGDTAQALGRARQLTARGGHVPSRLMEVLHDAGACPRPEAGTVGHDRGLRRRAPRPPGVIARCGGWPPRGAWRRAVVTFDRHPASVVRPESRRRAAHRPRPEAGAARGHRRRPRCWWSASTRSARRSRPRTSCARCWSTAWAPGRSCVGEDFHFGHQRKGNVDAAAGDGRPSSGSRSTASTLVGPDGQPRRRVGAGLLHRDPPWPSPRATSSGRPRMLGRPHEVRGVVDHGDDRAASWASRPPTCPCPATSSCPPTGSTPAGTAARRRGAPHGRSRSAAGRRSTRPPTRHCSRPTCSTSTATSTASRPGCASSTRLRGEVKFDGVEALVEQIGRDCDAGPRRSWLG